jgi:hypothetical protein
VQSSVDVVDQLFNSPGGKRNSTSTTDYYLRQTIREVKKDSSIDVKYKIDSVKISVQEDTMKVTYSSNRPADRKDIRFTEYNVIVGQEFGAILTKFGDILEMYDLQPMLAQVMKDLPDSMKTDRYKTIIGQRLQALLGQYVDMTITHFPDKPLAKDSSWGNHGETNFPVSQAVQFPVMMDSKETISRFEDHGGVTLAVLDSKYTEIPEKTVLEQQGVKASLKDFVSQSSSTTHIDDASGLVVRRTMSSKQSYVFTLESAQQAGKMAQTIQSSQKTLTVDLLE